MALTASIMSEELLETSSPLCSHIAFPLLLLSACLPGVVAAAGQVTGWGGVSSESAEQLKEERPCWPDSFECVQNPPPHTG